MSIISLITISKFETMSSDSYPILQYSVVLASEALAVVISLPPENHSAPQLVEERQRPWSHL